MCIRDSLFAILRTMKADGKAIVIITHKLHEVMAISDRVAVLRKGQDVYKRQGWCARRTW